MPQGKGTYGSQVGRPSKKRTSYVNDNGWNNKLNKGGNMPDNKTNSSILTKAPWTAKNDRFTSPPIPDMRHDVRSNPRNVVPNPKYDPKRDKGTVTQLATPRQYSNPIDGKKAEWSKFMTDMPKGYRTKEEIGAKRKELLAKK
jgi:hypothetical protein